jgi:hypothetical protein
MRQAPNKELILLKVPKGALKLFLVPNNTTTTAKLEFGTGFLPPETGAPKEA